MHSPDCISYPPVYTDTALADFKEPAPAQSEETYGPWSPGTPSRQAYDLDFEDHVKAPGHHIAEILDDYPTILLQSDLVHPCLLEPQIIRMTGLLSEWSPDLSLQRAVYSGVAKKDGQDIEVAVKFVASIEEAKMEVANYGHLEALQGTVIPRLYGMLFGYEKNSDEEVACLVLERFGSKLRLDFHQMDMVSRGEALNRLVDIHRAGFSHCDFARRNVVTKDGQYRIVDLADVTPHEGVCQWTFDFVENAGRVLPYSEQRALRGVCPIIFAAASEALYWSAGRLVLGGMYGVEAAPSLPKSHEVYQVPDVVIGLDDSYHYKESEKRDIAIKIYEEFKKQLDKYPMEHVIHFKNWTSYEVHRKWHAERNISFAPRLVPDEDGQWIHVGVRGFREREAALNLQYLSLEPNFDLSPYSIIQA
ncbi:hypothetical protein EIP91_007578 [Steccherinum ochraceum]|uniref:Uncharacterized protein n=1 Tax=Steccherinum ochraceum TaxID=92696 RepID=A0A4R0RQK8_9APHY|nr:hypothetical protein EIP91_007578 [Steccherinum ochraceum]